MKIYNFEQTRAIQTLFFLSKHEKVILSEIMDGVGGDYGTITRVLGLLHELKLIKDEIRKGQPTKRYIWITDKGKKIIPLFNKMEDVLSEDC